MFAPVSCVSAFQLVEACVCRRSWSPAFAIMMAVVLRQPAASRRLEDLFSEAVGKRASVPVGESADQCQEPRAL